MFKVIIESEMSWNLKQKLEREDLDIEDDVIWAADSGELETAMDLLSANGTDFRIIDGNGIYYLLMESTEGFEDACAILNKANIDYEIGNYDKRVEVSGSDLERSEELLAENEIEFEEV